MAQQVVIAGAMFNNVPAISVPDANNVFHSFLDTTIASNAASASDIANGKLAYVNGSLVTGTASGGGGGLEYEMGTWTPTSDIDDDTITFANTHNKAPWFYMVSDVTNDLNYGTTTNINCFYNNFSQLFGDPIPSTASTIIYGFEHNRYTNSSGSLTHATTNITTPYTSTSDTSIANSRFWATETGIKAYTTNNFRKWRAGRTYKWIAIWAPTS